MTAALSKFTSKVTCGSRERPFGGPSEIDARCPSGIYWYAVLGYNDGAPFQAYTDMTIDGTPMLVFHHMWYAGAKGDYRHPLEDGVGVGTSGWKRSYKLSNVGTLVSSMCPSTATGTERLYIGQHANDGEALSSASYLEWVAVTGKTGSELVDMFDSTPSTDSFTSGNGIRTKSGGTSGYRHVNGHDTGGWDGNPWGVIQMGHGGSVNQNVIFEYEYPDGGGHSWSVWGEADGTYYSVRGGDGAPSTTHSQRYGWMAIAGC